MKITLKAPNGKRQVVRGPHLERALRLQGWTDADLLAAINAAIETNKPLKPVRTKRIYDDHIIKATDLDRWVKRGIDFELRHGECAIVGGAGGRDAFGRWYIVSSAKAAEAKAAEAKAAEAKAAEDSEHVRLTPREWLIVKELDKNHPNT